MRSDKTSGETTRCDIKMNDNLGNINEISKNIIKETKSSEKRNNSNNIKKKI